MKKFRFVLLALVVAAVSFAFTKIPEEGTKAPSATYYAFDALGNFMGSASSIVTLKAQLCPGASQTFCAQVWTSKDENNHPAGHQEEDIRKPLP